ncbi:MAG: hypothetical protein E6I96_08670 [Chloroflexi bacterium]|nr:MAG: hypothetical protein E6I96_08670 [Chloroflexota bacterium]
MKVFRDVWATILTAVGLTLALSVTQGWTWPLLGDARAGIIALGVVGLAVCGSSGWAAIGFSAKDPLMITAIFAGVVLLVAGVIGLFANTMPYLVVMMVATAAIWLVATTRHLVEGGFDARPVPTA